MHRCCKTSIVWCFHSWFVTPEGSSVTPLQLYKIATAARTETALWSLVSLTCLSAQCLICFFSKLSYMSLRQDNAAWLWNIFWEINSTFCFRSWEIASAPVYDGRGNVRLHQCIIHHSKNKLILFRFKSSPELDQPEFKNQPCHHVEVKQGHHWY